MHRHFIHTNKSNESQINDSNCSSSVFNKKKTKTHSSTTKSSDTKSKCFVHSFALSFFVRSCRVSKQCVGFSAATIVWIQTILTGCWYGERVPKNVWKTKANSTTQKHTWKAKTKCESTDRNNTTTKKCLFIAEKWFACFVLFRPTKNDQNCKCILQMHSFLSKPHKETQILDVYMCIKCADVNENCIQMVLASVCVCIWQCLYVKWKQAIKFFAFLNCTWKTLEVDLHCTHLLTPGKILLFFLGVCVSFFWLNGFFICISSTSLTHKI